MIHKKIKYFFLNSNKKLKLDIDKIDILQKKMYDTERG